MIVINKASLIVRDAAPKDFAARLARSPSADRMVELRFFSGRSVEETAEVMGISPRTVDRQWQTAKAWLHREIGAGEAV